MFVRSTAELLFVGIVAKRVTAKPDWLESGDLAGRARAALGRGEERRLTVRAALTAGQRAQPNAVALPFGLRAGP